MNQIDPNFDWVTARSNCSPNAIFESLRKEAKADVEKRRTLLSPEELAYDLEFNFTSSTKAFKVFRVFMEQDVYVLFARTENGVKVTYGDSVNAPPLLATLTLGDDQECKLKTEDGVERNFWQFRRIALEPVLFGVMS